MYSVLYKRNDSVRRKKRDRDPAERARILEIFVQYKQGKDANDSKQRIGYDVCHFIVYVEIGSEMGLHDEDISKEEILKQGLATPEEYEILEKYTLALFERGSQIAAERGLILVDTKYEFGKHNGTIYLMDEIHTPDSSRYFYAEGYQERFEKGEAQKQLSKEFVREWLMDNGFQGKEGQQVPEMTEEIVNSISERYMELFENITGEKFVKADVDSIADRIEKNVTEYLK